MREDYDCPKCFECGDECSEVDGKLICNECGHIYTEQEWEAALDKRNAEYVRFMENLEESKNDQN